MCNLTFHSSCSNNVRIFDKYDFQLSRAASSTTSDFFQNLIFQFMNDMYEVGQRDKLC